MMKRALALISTFLLISLTQSKFYVVKQWQYVNFTWPDEESLSNAQSKGLYTPENIIISDVNYFEHFYYLTLPRMKSGVPVTLARIQAGSGNSTSPPLEPYPSWSMNDVEDCANLQNVQDIEIDTQGQMWIIDAGRIHSESGSLVKCVPKLIIFDIKANRTNRVYHFPEDVASKSTNHLYGLVVDNTEGGFAYITDNSHSDPGIVVYSVGQNRSWKVRHTPSMLGDSSSQFTVNNISISTRINIAGIALGPKIHTSNAKLTVNEDREVYFSPVSSLHLYSINTTTLRNENLAQNSEEIAKAIKDLGEKPSQSSAMIMDNQGTLYFTLLSDNSIAKWDSHTPFKTGQKIIAQDKTYLEWPNSLTFDDSGNLTVLVNRLERFVFDKLDLNEFNFRLISSNVDARSYLQDDNFKYHLESNSTTESTSEQHMLNSSTEKSSQSTGKSTESTGKSTETTGITSMSQSSSDRCKIAISTMILLLLRVTLL